MAIQGFWEPVRRTAGNGRSLVSIVKSRMRLAFGVEPLSYKWGFDRGVPIHRFYLDQFLREFSQHIRGRCLEFNDLTYTSRFGFNVEKADILHIDDSNKKATIVADLTKPNDIPCEIFDCIICTHVLHVVTDPFKAVSEMHRILKPGGSLLVAVSQVSMNGLEYRELYRFTAEGLKRILAFSFGSENVEIRNYGNSLTSAGEIRGLAAHEFSDYELSKHDDRFAVEVCGWAKKSECRERESVHRYEVCNPS